MRAPSLALLLLLCSATAAAHDETFRAAWVQPLAPLVARNVILPLGFTHGLWPGGDLSVEFTPYAGLLPGVKFAELDAGTCPSGSCPGGVFGMIGTAGLAAWYPLFSTANWEMEATVTTKLVGGVATKPSDPDFSGMSCELGVGLDIGLQMHAHGSGFYAAIVLGAQMTAAFTTGRIIIAPTWPVMEITGSPLIPRQGDLMLYPNLNLFRLGWAF